ncbi:MAG: PilN domain-containing protein [Candidatus Omnitrophica bacterium]|nr:PilN domain-containing protein [Candidatus Omnitrophota bacterium]
MIEINLLPQELRPKKKTYLSQNLWLVWISVLGIILGLHVLFSLLIITGNLQYNILNKRWLSNQDKFKKVEEWKAQQEALLKEQQQALKFLQQRTIIYPKLISLSKFLPKGMWFNHLVIKLNTLSLEGSVISLKEEHMSIVRLFLENLKKDKNLVEIQLGPLKRRKISNYEVLDFILEAKLK